MFQRVCMRLPLFRLRHVHCRALDSLHPDLITSGKGTCRFQGTLRVPQGSLSLILRAGQTRIPSLGMACVS